MKPISEQTIFISIASYCDPLLQFTINNAYNSATFPHNLRFGVVDQSPAGDRLILSEQIASSQLSYVQIDPRDARGTCWARSLAMMLYAGEDWFFQIDSHMLFDKGWDQTLIAAAERCATINTRCILSSYPNAFEMIGNQAKPKPVTRQVLAHVLAKDAQFEEGHPVLRFQALPINKDVPVVGFHVGAGCLFAAGRFQQEVPYDPHLYFHGEEQTLAVRAYTHGWDIFHINALPIYHLYDTGKGQVVRPKHWSEEHDKQRRVRWWEREAESKARMKALLCDCQDLGIYGLGKQRSLADYAEFCGIDYAARSINEKARQGPWAIAT